MPCRWVVTPPIAPLRRKFLPLLGRARKLAVKTECRRLKPIEVRREKHEALYRSRRSKSSGHVGFVGRFRYRRHRTDLRSRDPGNSYQARSSRLADAEPNF